MVHPIKGVRFTPYTNVKVNDIVMAPPLLLAEYENDSVIPWGVFDGSGEPMELAFSQYLKQFIWDHDYTAAPEVLWDSPKQRGNIVENAMEFYGPAIRMVEYHFPGFDPQYEGMDWESLRLVLEEYEGKWMLVGIIHDQWTV